MSSGTAIVRNVPLTFDRKIPEGDPLYPGDARVVEAWHAKARRDARASRGMLLALLGLGIIVAAGGLGPAWVALAAVAAVAVVYPLALVSGNARARQRPFDIFEKGVHGTERRALLRFRRFAPFPEIVKGDAREVVAGKFHVRLTLIDGTHLESIPGEVTNAGVEYLAARTGEQVQVAHLAAPRENPGQRVS